MILSILTAIIPAVVAAFPGSPGRAPRFIDPAENCRFRVRSRQYALCHLFDKAAEWPLVVNGKGKEVYRFHLGLGMRDGGSSPDLGSQCSPGTRICLITEGPSESHKAISISGASSEITAYPEDSDEFITLQFAGDSEDTARVQFFCDPQADLGKPTLLRVEEMLHVFAWRTKYACEPSRSALHTLDAEADEPPPNDTSDPNEDSEQLLESDRQRKSRRSTAIIFLIISIFITSICIISYKYPNRFNLLMSEHIKPIFHRLSLDNFPRISIPSSLKPAGEGRLVRWAHEDLELDEDLMVNGSDAYGDAYDEPDEVGDESIPLRPSPRKGGRALKNYGSATSPFW
ncbi:hypothetical protein DFH09DRAFT_574038 [Mycena vulgaris]|nr:hypothetical protein DFH09DRAFT_574038 [Mycena vulgaris]